MANKLLGENTRVRSVGVSWGIEERCLWLQMSTKYCVDPQSPLLNSKPLWTPNPYKYKPLLSLLAPYHGRAWLSTAEAMLKKRIQPQKLPSEGQVHWQAAPRALLFFFLFFVYFVRVIVSCYICNMNICFLIHFTIHFCIFCIFRQSHCLMLHM